MRGECGEIMEPNHEECYYAMFRSLNLILVYALGSHAKVLNGSLI